MIPKTTYHPDPLEPSELIVTEQGAIYHLNLRPHEIADTIIVVGDQNRVERVSRHFDIVEHRIENREFVTHTGRIGNVGITVMSTGIGCDNIDIVVNELDALANIDLETRTINKNPKSLNIIRLGTSGALQEDIPVDSFVISTYGLGFDGLLNFYEATFSSEELAIQSAFTKQTGWTFDLNPPYIAKGSADLLSLLGDGMIHGITATAHGFYGPQGRSLRLSPKINDLNEKLRQFEFNGHRITNFEMETSALYGLSGSLGHHACTVCAIIANRFKKEYSKDYKATVDRLIIDLLEKIVRKHVTVDKND